MDNQRFFDIIEILDNGGEEKIVTTIYGTAEEAEALVELLNKVRGNSDSYFQHEPA